MSSADECCLVSSGDLRMLQSVLADFGYGFHMLEKTSMSTLPRKIVQLYQTGNWTMLCVLMFSVASCFGLRSFWCGIYMRFTRPRMALATGVPVWRRQK